MPTESSFGEQLERLEQIQAASPEPSGSPVTLRLEVPFGHRVPLRIEIVRIMSRCGLRPREGKPAMEQLLHDCQITVTLPAVQDVADLVAELAKADVTATVVEPAFAQ